MPRPIDLVRALSALVLGGLTLGLGTLLLDVGPASVLPLTVAVLAVPLALAFEPRGRTRARGPGAARVVAVAAAATVLGAGVLTAANAGDLDRHSIGTRLARFTRTAPGPLAALTAGLAALPAPLLLLLARRTSLRLHAQAASGALGLALPAALSAGAVTPATWIALLGGWSIGAAGHLADRSERGELDHGGALQDADGVPFAQALPGLVAAAAGPCAAALLLVHALWTTPAAARDVPALLEDTAGAVRRYVEQHGAPPAALSDVAGVDSGVALGLHDGYLYRYSCVAGGWWGLAADPADPAADTPSFRRVGPDGVVEEEGWALPLAPGR